VRFDEKGMIISLVNQKGGAGKTTLAVHLAVYLADQGLPVAFVDADPQGSAALWLNGASPEMPVASPEDGMAVHRDIAAFVERGFHVVADAPPRLNDATRVLMYHSDLIIVPVTPSTVDLRATLTAKDHIDAVQKARVTDGLSPASVKIVINRVRARTELSATILAVLKGMGVPVAKHSVALREIYPKAATLDSVVARMTKDKKHAVAAKQAADELDALFTEVLSDVSIHQQAA
jgi:chromosome partitioning protein